MTHNVCLRMYDSYVCVWDESVCKRLPRMYGYVCIRCTVYVCVCMQTLCCMYAHNVMYVCVCVTCMYEYVWGQASYVCVCVPRMYVYVCIRVPCMYEYIYADCMCMYAHDVCVCLCMYAHTVCVCMHTSQCMSAYVCLRLYAYVCRMYVCMFARIRIRAQAYNA